jgi:3-hydroxyisobutyrate dehydrogenase
MKKTPLGFIGLGIMGGPMAGHIVRAGYPLTVYNRTRSRTKELEAQGARVADSPSELASISEIVITMVSDSPDVEAVIAGPAGVLSGIRAGSVVVDMSTASPEIERRLDRQLRERDCGLVDAPVSGGDVGARNATLAIMAGGERRSFDRVRPVLEKLGRSITHCGPVGSGQLTKLCNQILVSATLLGVGEALAFARKGGLDPAIMIEAVRDGAAGSWQLANLGPKILEGDFAPGFMIDLMQKDLGIVLDTAGASGAALPGTALVHQLFRSAQALGDGRRGTQALARVLDRLSRIS